jgi:hypothetical protein
LISKTLNKKYPQMYILLVIITWSFEELIDFTPRDIFVCERNMDNSNSSE